MPRSHAATEVAAVQVRLAVHEVRRLDSIVAEMQAKNPRRVVMRGAVVRQAVAEFLSRRPA